MVEAVPLKPKRAAKPKFPPGFVVGARVKLRSGGIPITVTDLLSGNPPAVHCEWMNSGFDPCEKSYPVAALRLAEDDEAEDDDRVEGEEEAEE